MQDLGLFWQLTLKTIEDLKIVSSEVIALEMFIMQLIHIKGITQSLILFFISSIPMLLLNKNSINYNMALFKKADNLPQTKTKYDSNLWEEASLEDVNSGEYETI